LARESHEEERVDQELKRGDRVEWNFRGRKVVGTVRRKLSSRAEIGGRVIAASKEAPRYVVRSEKSGKETVRRSAALRKLR
jgi:Hypervirulence associated proteins TUDOR domain